MNQKGTVYLSSTFGDLAAEREAVSEAALRAGLVPFRFEGFQVGTDFKEILRSALAEADLFVLILAYRLGYTFPDSGQSGVEFEFEEAIRLNKSIIVFMLSEDAPWPASEFPRGKELARVEAFRRKVTEGFIVSWFKNVRELREQALVAFLQSSIRIADQPEHEPQVIPTQTVPAQQALESLDVGPVLLEIRSQLATLVRGLADEPVRRQESDGPKPIPAIFLGSSAPTIDLNKVFIVMPYSEVWSEAVENIIREACESAQFQFEIAKSKDGRYIIHDIWKGLTGSAVTVADLTGANPNVAYEVGLADVLGREVIIISQDTEVPVDFRGARLILYTNSIEGALRLREELTDRLKSIRERLHDSIKA